MAMTKPISRRDVLIGLLGTAGCAAAGRRRTGCAAEASSGPRPDRSAEAPSLPVSIQRCESFEPQLLREKLAAALDQIGGIGPLVRDKTVTIKINLTGMTWDPVFHLPAYETYQTHPHSLAALCAILADAGARRIVVVENLYWDRPVEKSLIDAGWNLSQIQSAGGHKVTFEDTRNRGSFPGYSRFQVPWGGFIFPGFDMNQRFEKTDVLVSLAKLKQHATAGITGAVKNLFGNTPSSIYGDDGPGEHALKHRAAMFHGGRGKPPAGAPQELAHGLPNKGTVRVPRITADIFGARPADLNIVEGIRSISGGEGHWNQGIALVEPKLLIVGRNGVCTDAVCTAAMGFDPQAEHGQFPFQGDNHLRLLAAVGVGTNDPQRIEVRGLPLAQAVFPYASKPRPAG
jgi:uncharacterized protein (DUF362 family)